MTIFESIPATNRPLFPGEIEVIVGLLSHDRKRHFPGVIHIRFWHVSSYKNYTPAPSKRMSGGKWKLSLYKSVPAMISLHSISMIGGITRSFVREQQPGLRNLLGEAIAKELQLVAFDVMEQNRGLTFKSPVPKIRLRFKDQDQFAEMMVDLQKQALPKKADERKLLEHCLLAWTSEQFGTDVHLAYYAEHRPDDPALQPAYDAEVEAFKALAHDSEAVLRPRLDSLKKTSGKSKSKEAVMA